MILSDIFLILLVCLALVTILSGYPVGLSLGGSAILAALAGWSFGVFDPIFFFAFPARLFGVVTSQVLLAIPLFVLMGVILEKSGIAARMFDHIAWATRHVSGGLALSITLVGTLMAASTGIVGASVVTLGMIALPALLRSGTSPSHAAGRSGH